VNSLEQDPAAEPQSAADLARRRRGLKTGFYQGSGLWHGRLRRAERLRLIVVVNGLEDPDDRASKRRKCWEWGFRISKPGHGSRHSSWSVTPRCLAARAFGQARQPEPIKVMVQKKRRDK